MANISLAVKYRPESFDDLVEQKAIKTILDYQLDTNTFVHSYLFTGPAGCGKTTSARIFANCINSGKGNPIEVDAASNTGVDNIRLIIDDAKKKSIDSEYKIFIIDECHMLSNGAWNAMLKLLEEPPAGTIFILCTTDPQKIPATILSRVQRYDFNKISQSKIVERLKFIAESENRKISDDALIHIAKVSDGGMRDAITMLDKCFSFRSDEETIEIEDIIEVLGTADYDTYFKFLYELAVGDKDLALVTLQKVYDDGVDIKQFIKQFMYFLSDVGKAKLTGSLDYTSIPNTESYRTKVQDEDLSSIVGILERFIEIDSNVKWESNPKMMLQIYIVTWRELS